MKDRLRGTIRHRDRERGTSTCRCLSRDLHCTCCALAERKLPAGSVPAVITHERGGTPPVAVTGAL